MAEKVEDSYGEAGPSAPKKNKPGRPRKMKIDSDVSTSEKKEEETQTIAGVQDDTSEVFKVEALIEPTVKLECKSPKKEVLDFEGCFDEPTVKTERISPKKEVFDSEGFVDNEVKLFADPRIQEVDFVPVKVEQTSAEPVPPLPNIPKRLNPRDPRPVAEPRGKSTRVRKPIEMDSTDEMWSDEESDGRKLAMLRGKKRSLHRRVTKKSTENPELFMAVEIRRDQEILRTPQKRRRQVRAPRDSSATRNPRQPPTVAKRPAGIKRKELVMAKKVKHNYGEAGPSAPKKNRRGRPRKIKIDSDVSTAEKKEDEMFKVDNEVKLNAHSRIQEVDPVPAKVEQTSSELVFRLPNIPKRLNPRDPRPVAEPRGKSTRVRKPIEMDSADQTWSDEECDGRKLAMLRGKKRRRHSWMTKESTENPELFMAVELRRDQVFD